MTARTSIFLPTSRHVKPACSQAQRLTRLIWWSARQRRFIPRPGTELLPNRRRGGQAFGAAPMRERLRHLKPSSDWN